VLRGLAPPPSMTTRSSPSLTRAATRLGLAVAWVLALLPPVLWLAVGGLIEHGESRVTARGLAVLLQRSALAGATDAELTRSMGQLAAPTEGASMRWRIALPGRTLASEPDASGPRAPTFTVTQTAQGPASTASQVAVERSLRPLLAQTLWVALLSCGLALAGWRFGIGRVTGLMGQVESRMRSLASLDPLTGLLNREGLRRRLQRALDRHASDRVAVGLLLIDVDRFGLINETLGQAAGDALLCSVADRIRSVTRSGDGLARAAADQFAVHVDTATGLDALQAVGRNLQRAFEAPHDIDGRPLVTSVSIGIALVSAAGSSVDRLLHQAAQALRSAKRSGGNRMSAYQADDAMDDGAYRMDLEQRLRGALGAGQFFLVYQPIVDARRERTGTVEVLLRWQDPERGTVSPADFIPALEQTGLIVPVGRWVLQQACAQAARWPGPTAVDVSVNLSPLQFAEPDFLQMVAAVLRETGLPARRLQLEVTEGLLLAPTPEALRKINALADLGVRLAIDDFGMGYSSLSYLKRFRLHALKIDRMFVRDIADRPEDRTIVQAIIDLGHGLGMQVTAEGVETRAQADALRDMGCDSLQGYLFGRPASVEALLQGGTAWGMPTGARRRPAQAPAVADRDAQRTPA
jgi:diguanylate cyclase (GGDEF)-like protein